MKIIEAVDIPDAWYQLISSVFDDGYSYVIQHGSFVEETRIEFKYITVKIKYPYNVSSDGSYNAMLPKIPESLNIDPPVADGYVEQYLPYIMEKEITENETYTYGSRLHQNNQIEKIIKLLKKTPNTNQAILQVASPSDIDNPDPPCLRHIGCKVIKGEFTFFPYFRSWDLVAGFPANLAALAVFQKYMADEIGIENGGMIASSHGAHIYGYAEEIMKIRTYRK